MHVLQKMSVLRGLCEEPIDSLRLVEVPPERQGHFPVLSSHYSTALAVGQFINSTGHEVRIVALRFT